MHIQIMGSEARPACSGLREHSALCAAVCKMKLDKCSPHTVAHWCLGLGVKILWKDRYVLYLFFIFLFFLFWCGKIKAHIVQYNTFIESSKNFQPGKIKIKNNSDFYKIVDFKLETLIL